MHKIKRFFLIALYLLSSNKAQADFFSCKDNAGHLITSDRPIPECANKSTQVYKDNGVLKTQFAPALTSEQRRAAELQEQQHAKEALQLEQNKKEQRYLLAHYPTEQDVEIMRQKALDAIQIKIETEKHVIAASVAAIKKIREGQAQIPKNQPDKTVDAQRKADDLTETIKQCERLMRNYQSEEINTNLEFDATHKRYSEIVVLNKK